MDNNKIFTLIFALIVSVGMVSCDKNGVMEAEKSMTKEMVNPVTLEGKWTNMATAKRLQMVSQCLRSLSTKQAMPSWFGLIARMNLSRKMRNIVSPMLMGSFSW